MHGLDWESLYVTMKLAGFVTPLLVAVALPLAYIPTRCVFLGRSLLNALCSLPLVLPPTVVGFYLLLIMGPKSPVGQAWEFIFGRRLVFSFSGLVLASMVFSLPFAVQPLRTAFEKIDSRLYDAAAVMGCKGWSTFFKVALPNCYGGIAAASILVFAHTMGEFGVALMVGGSIPGKTRVASIAVFEYVESLEYGRAATLSLVLIPVGLAVLLILDKLNKRTLHGA